MATVGPFLNDADLIHNFVASRKSVLDTLFIHTKRGRAVYATQTRDSVTNYYSIDDSGHLLTIGKICWEAGESSGVHEVEYKGKKMTNTEFVRPSKRHIKSWFFGVHSWIFTAGDRTLKWKQASASGGWWTCHYQGPTNSLAANYVPRMLSSGLRNGELRVSETALEFVDTIILSLVLLTTKNAEWKTVKSPYTKETLEASLRSDATGSLPPYIPQLDTPNPRRSVRRSTVRRPRRPQTAGARPYADSINPPAYASRADIITPY